MYLMKRMVPRIAENEGEAVRHDVDREELALLVHVDQPPAAVIREHVRSTAEDSVERLFLDDAIMDQRVSTPLEASRCVADC
jgi:uncharacterized protein (DUF924 family)